ncbi:hypothetical protein FRB99_008065 [Tulasnella sp. 403]|nr:hypothetical protein FRB99_008065 [Tulasnella sp. 403]
MLRARVSNDSLNNDHSSLDVLDASEMDPFLPGSEHYPDGNRRPLDVSDDELPNVDPLVSRDAWLPKLGRIASKKYPRTTAIVQRVWTFLRGPSPPIALRPTPLLDRPYAVGKFSFAVSLESKWRRLTNPFRSLLFFSLFVVVYIICLSFIVRANWFLVPADVFTGCTAAFWGAKNDCGLNGQNCEPFQSDTPIDFRCPAACASVELLNIRTVGDEEVIYQPLVVGGGDDQRTYRGDSWVCAAALHAGVISDSHGGCAAVQLVGNYTSFVGTIAHGLSSVSFPTSFPLSYRILPSSSLSSCSDLRDPALAFNILITVIIFVILRPKPIILFWCLVCIGFWHITFFSSPRGEPPPLSDAFGFFLPTLFIAYAFWLHAFQHVLPFFEAAPLERAVWYLVPFWCGVLINVITAKLPIDRLLASDLHRPGAITTLVIISLLLLVIVVNQMRVIRKTGWLPRYLAYYAAGGIALLVLSMLPGLTLRMHHYFFSMLLIAGTAFPTRLSAVYQAFLLGMFLEGASRWGFDSILQTAEELQRDAPLGSSLPEFLTNATNPLANLSATLSWKSWEANASDEGWNGFSLLVDDVERYSGNALNFSLSTLQLLPGVPHFFRLAPSKTVWCDMPGNPARKFSDLVFSASSKYPNWDPPRPIKVGEYGVLNPDTAEFEREGNIYDDPDFANIVKGKPPEPSPAEDRIVITSNHVKGRELGLSGDLDATIAEASFKWEWTFGRHAAAILVAFYPRLDSLNRTLDIKQLIEHPKLRGKHIVKDTITCPKYVLFFSRKGNDRLLLALSVQLPVAPVAPVSAGPGAHTGCVMRYSLGISREAGFDPRVTEDKEYTILFGLKRLKLKNPISSIVKAVKNIPGITRAAPEEEDDGLEKLEDVEQPWPLLDSDGEEDPAPMLSDSEGEGKGGDEDEDEDEEQD